MSIFKSSNPTLQEKTYQGTILEGISTGEEMTLKGTMNKFGVLVMLMIGSTLFAWSQFYKGSDPKTFMMVGVFGGLALALVMAFKMKWSTFLAPAYAILEVVVVATAAIAVFYLIQWLTYSFSGTAVAYSFTNSSSPISIGFSILVSGLAAFNLLLNFDTVEKGVEMRAPKYMEWYSAFGLLVTVVWLYLELLRLLSKFNRN